MLYMSEAVGVTTVENIQVPGIGHNTFNWNVHITEGAFAGRHLYDVYFDLLNGGAVP